MITLKLVKMSLLNKMDMKGEEDEGLQYTVKTKRGV